MAFNNITSRTDVGALIPEEVSKDMLNNYVPKESAALTMFRRIPVGRAQVRFPVVSALPTAYWVTGDTGLKQTSEINWANKFLNIEEIAVIIPVPDNVLSDVDANIWDEATPLLAEAVGRTVDSAVFFGSNAPASFPTNVMAAAAAAGNSVTEGSVATAGAFWGDLDAALALLEADGYDSTGIIASTTVRAKLRASRNSQGDKLDSGRADGSFTNIDGNPVSYPMRGMWPTGAGTGVRLFTGDWRQFVLGVRQDINIKFSSEAVIQDNTGAIIYNSFQQDLTFLRLTFRLGWQVANTVNQDQPTDASRYPVAVLRTSS